MQNKANGDIQYEIMDLLLFPGIPDSMDCSMIASANESKSLFKSQEDFIISVKVTFVEGSTIVTVTFTVELATGRDEAPVVTTEASE